WGGFATQRGRCDDSTSPLTTNAPASQASQRRQISRSAQCHTDQCMHLRQIADEKKPGLSRAFFYYSVITELELQPTLLRDG
ncbi:hypothetical protein, partial [Pseudomonas sp. SWRI 103]|uniref:hypothetical protein n=1 Tax=Pseudomonas sp. SWRI 103 TaxID=2725411 RepID=UPI001C498687